MTLLRKWLNNRKNHIAYAYDFFLLKGENVMKKMLIFICCLMMFLCPIQAVEQHSLNIESKQMLVVNMNDSLNLYEKNTNDLIQLESMVRLVLVVIAIENEAQFNQTRAGVDFNTALLNAVSSKQGARDLAAAMMGEERMVELMNEKAQGLNLIKTNFVNVDGTLDINQITTVNELMQILKTGMEHQAFKQLLAASQPSIKTKCDELMLDSESLLGGIHLSDAMLSLHLKNGLTLLCLSMNGSGNKAFTDMDEAVGYFYKNYQWVKIIDEGEEIAELPVKWGDIHSELTFISDNEYYALLPINYNKEDIVKEVVRSETLIAPIEENQYVGEYIIRYSGEIVLTIPLFSNQNIDHSIFRYGFDLAKEWILKYPLYALMLSILLLILVIRAFLRKKHVEV